MSQSKSEKPAIEKPKPRKSAFRRFIGTVITAFFFGFLLLVAVNIYAWINQGYDGMMQNINRHYQIEINAMTVRNKNIATYSIAAFSLMNDYVSRLMFRGKQKINQMDNAGRLNVFGFLPNESAVKNNKQNKRNKSNKSAFANDEKANQGNHNNFMSDIIFSIPVLFQSIVAMLWASFWVLVFKFISVFSAILIYVFAGLLGALDGLVMRYVRTAEGGRESTFIFHKMTDTILQIPIWLIFIYLLSPVLINPTWIIVLLSLSFFLVFNIATANLKKFL